MKTKLEMHGSNTLEIEVTNISIHGFWLLISGKEFFLPFEKFPWFKSSSIDEIHHIQLLHNTHLYWPSLDIDLDIDSIEDTDKYPLIAS
jgi:hypothetical protein